MFRQLPSALLPVGLQPRVDECAGSACQGSGPTGACLDCVAGVRWVLDAKQQSIPAQFTARHDIPTRVNGFVRHALACVIRPEPLEYPGNLLRRPAPTKPVDHHIQQGCIGFKLECALAPASHGTCSTSRQIGILVAVRQSVPRELAADRGWRTMQYPGNRPRTRVLRIHQHQRRSFFSTHAFVSRFHRNTLSGCCTWSLRPPHHFQGHSRSISAGQLAGSRSQDLPNREG